jgi:hypothetical protein
VLFKIYYYEDKSAKGMQEGRIVLTDQRRKDVGQGKHFNYFDRIPTAMRKLLRERNATKKSFGF